MPIGVVGSRHYQYPNFPESKISNQTMSAPSSQPTTMSLKNSNRCIAGGDHFSVSLRDVRCRSCQYTFRTKDPRLSSSRLTRYKSDRFQTVLYRVVCFFVCLAWPPCTCVGRARSKRLREIQRDVREQAKSLQSFTLTPLLEVDLGTWAIRAEFFPQKNCNSYLVWCSPRTTLQAFRGNLTSVDQKVVPALRTSYEQFCEIFNFQRGAFNDDPLPRSLPSLTLPIHAVTVVV
ncbi:hypothetical protein L210DRAFT_3170915 [Boletus edulis BED1]|uniref:Uncharacterized protein n=1 Tax=Boletus edulis BED1 TaxID=1328754 RepID=A0AAD4BZB4_BOLED|nr:hypothetical protein L210DRAFT_3170915 [Boletus edulis BED1]